MATKWTPAQQKAIDEHEHNLLVSAAAGSGKTAVLAARCVALICDPEHPCNADELLVVTFTNAAAAEMRQRITRLLNEKAVEAQNKDDPDAQRLQRQTLLLAGAQIGTIHSFCATMLRRYFHELGIDPAFRLLDEDEAALQRRDLMDELVEERLADPESSMFARLTEQYANGSVLRIGEIILRLYQQQSALPDSSKWLAERHAKLEEAIDKPIRESALGKEMLGLLEGRRASIEAEAQRLEAALRRQSGYDKYADFVALIANAAADWKDALTRRPFDQIADIIGSTDFGRLPVLKPAPPDKEAWQKRINALRDEVKGLAGSSVLRFTEDELKLHLRQTAWASAALAELVDAFRKRFDAQKRQNGTLDFNDLEHLALKLLRDDHGEPTAVARAYRQQFRYVLVDEYQDINELQDTLLQMVADESRGNLFCVGDAKQSIYRFRQADLQRFINRYIRYKKMPGSGEVIDLQQNFRSRGRLLETLNAIFERLMTKESAELRYDKSQRLVPGATYYGEGDRLFTGSPLEFHVIEKDGGAAGAREYESDEREAVLISSRLREILGLDGQPGMLVTERDGQTRPAEPGDIAILLRAMHIKAERFATTLRRAGIPVRADSTTGFFAATEVQDLLATLRLIDNRRSDYDVAGYLRSPLCGLERPEGTLAEIRLAYKDLPFHQAAERFVRDRSDSVAVDVGQSLGNIELWREVAQQSSVAELVERILTDTSYAVFVAGLPDGPQRSANLAELLDRARGFEKFRRPTLSRFLHYIANLQDAGDLGMPPADGASRNAVRVMSVHKSKGLEFPIVVLPDLGKEHNLRDASGLITVDESVGLALRGVDTEREAHFPSLTSTIAQHHIRRRALAEELRVLYVAATRAKEHLILVGTDTRAAIEEWDEEWRGHSGPLPAGAVLAGRSMLDWLGPAMALAEAASPGSIQRHEHTCEAVEELGKKLLDPANRGLDAGPMQKLRPIDGIRTPPPRVAAAMERVEMQYPFEKYSELPAVVAVTDQVRTNKKAAGGENPSQAAVVTFERILRAPRFLTQDQRLSPADAGSVTHTVMQRLDFAKAAGELDVRQQVQRMVERRFLRREEAEQVQIDKILWFLSTDLGQRFRTAKTLLRELDVIYAEPADGSNDPLDQTMVRGRLDAALVEDAGLTLVDYKTDRVTADTVAQRAAFYRPQIEIYRSQLERLTKRPVTAAYLVFLAARTIVPC